MHMVYKVLVLVLATCAYGRAEDPWAPQGGARFHTSHAVTFPLTQEDVSFPDPEIKEVSCCCPVTINIHTFSNSRANVEYIHTYITYIHTYVAYTRE
jgi:hypothetical protein